MCLAKGPLRCAGPAVKVKLMAIEIKQGTSACGGKLAASTVKDADRLAEHLDRQQHHLGRGAVSHSSAERSDADG